MVLLCVFIGVAAPLASLGFAASILMISVGEDVVKESGADDCSKDWVSIV